ncbi:MAG: peptide-methionine (S)-S-oxide reductase MsrA [Thermoplasmatota archaeon]
MEKTIFGAGCFWGVQASFDQLEGVVETEVGYSGGHTKDPTYKEVCSDRTGHAEVVRVVFDPSVISFRELLDHFFEIHDPTTPNRQGPDIGSQYRSVIFYGSEGQRREAEEARKRWEGKYPGKIVTEIAEAGPFYRAEEYHQKYFQKNGYTGCGINI